MIYFLFATQVRLAHSTGFKGWCAKALSKIIADEPYPYEQTDILFLVNTLDRLCLKKRWRPLSALEASDFDRLTLELKRRQAYGSDHDRELADYTLIRCAQ